MGKNTANFLRLLEEQNAVIAAQEAERKAQLPKPDQIRLQREQERREKWGTLRARKHPGRRPVRSYNVFPHVDPS